ncbi:Phosphoribosyl 1,2-cyclic phosphodiesterase [Dehalogenimonas formicexedens]|uniref:Phosphoribosyl 1,2-cyclic phosphodiesterase n=1 Tax=Dehalogenimonas formicexedens TaxID=1839801 RepID=A0A1P8F8S9_9CHLR|nr:MBL fold metallo-hydrolase [Dehalogenimonas formicexedens]APV44879.1 Phosphoribosyl 1,2-cyclic phosphodiesterase [Dehalogenimonas formicexedens]
MKIKFLGAHNCETATTGMMCILVDDRVVIDAGSLTRNMTLDEMFKIKALLLTHGHLDHFRDVATLGMNLFLNGRTIDVFGSEKTRAAISEHILNGAIYSKFFDSPENNPTLRFNTVKAGVPFKIDGYDVMPVTLPHPVPVLGYQLTDAWGKNFFYTGDTGTGLSRCVEQISPDFMAVDVTASSKYTEFFSVRNQHLTSETLGGELKSFRQLKGYLPPVACVHMSPFGEPEIAAEIDALSAELCSPVYLAREGLIVDL